MNPESLSRQHEFELEIDDVEIALRCSNNVESEVQQHREVEFCAVFFRVDPRVKINEIETLTKPAQAKNDAVIHAPHQEGYRLWHNPLLLISVINGGLHLQSIHCGKLKDRRRKRRIRRQSHCNGY